MTDSDRKKTIMQELNGETSTIPWSEMQKFFANGSAMFVDSSLDLIETAAEIAMDNKQALDAWMKEEKVAPVSDEQATRWLDEDAVVWAVVLAPWVFVQPARADQIIQ